MQSGQLLTDTDHAPWLGAITQAIDTWQARNACGIITCSALKRACRRRIIGERIGVRLVFLDGLRELIAQRLTARHGHFMPPSLLATRFAVLEPPSADENPIAVTIDQPVNRIVEHIAAQLPAGSESARRAALTG
jgi:carbohydrate kinase (thermoresistant glucokinase family)